METHTTPHPQPSSTSRSGATMRAVVQRAYGTADTLGIAEMARPVIGDRDVLVEVRAAGMDRGTWHLMAGQPYALRLAFGLRAPKNPVPGLDVAGVVIAVGAAVTRFQPGAEVFGVGKGSFAELSAAREDKLAPKPAGVTFEQAAAVPVSGLTALRAVCDVGQVEAGQRVLVVGASGGVGTYTVQIAKAVGAEVTGVCSTGKVDLVRSIGADHVLDYTRDDFADGTQTYDVIIDIGGNASLSRLRRALAPAGTLVIAGGEDGGSWFGLDRQLRALAVSPFTRQRLKVLVSKEHFSGLERLKTFLDKGTVVPVVERTFSLEDVPAAMRHLVGGHARGKLVIVP